MVQKREKRLIYGLANIEIPITVSEIGKHAFFGQKNLTEITIPESVDTISDFAFEGSGLIKLVIPGSITTIGAGITANCKNLKSIVVDPENEWYDSRQDCNAIIETESDTLVAACQSTNIPENIKRVGKNAFEACGMTEIILPDSVTKIGSGAFSNNDVPFAITLSPNIDAIPTYAFEYSTGLTSIIIPDSVKSIGHYAFNGCSKLTTITIPQTVKAIKVRAFMNCSSLVDIQIPSISEIPDYAFCGCSGLTKIVIPDSVKEIESFAFKDCTSLTEISFSSQLRELYGAFNGCTSLKKVEIPEWVVSAMGTFDGCTSLEEVIFNGVVPIRLFVNVFGHCTNLKHVTFNRPILPWANDTTVAFEDQNLKIETVTIGPNFMKSKYVLEQMNHDALTAIYVPAGMGGKYKVRIPKELHHLIKELEVGNL